MTTMRGIVAGLAIILGLAPGAAAFSFNEIGDAGNLPAFSQAAGVLSPGDPIGTITGSIGSSTDADMFAITTTTTGNIFANTIGRPGTLVDTQLFLFRFPGFGLVANDDNGKTLRSFLTTEAVTSSPFQGVPPGLYFLGISSFNVDPVSAGGLIFPNAPFDGVFGPTGPGGASAITGWQGSGATGTYTVDVALSSVPEPGTLLLWGTSAAGFGLAWWRRRRAP